MAIAARAGEWLQYAAANLLLPNPPGASRAPRGFRLELVSLELPLPQLLTQDPTLAQNTQFCLQLSLFDEVVSQIKGIFCSLRLVGSFSTDLALDVWANLAEHSRCCRHNAQPHNTRQYCHHPVFRDYILSFHFARVTGAPWLVYFRDGVVCCLIHLHHTHSLTHTVIAEAVAITTRPTQPPRELSLGWRAFPLFPSNVRLF